MTNKTYRFAAVAAVLLALCLVFMAPVSAEAETPAGVCSEDTHDNCCEALVEGTSIDYYFTTFEQAVAYVNANARVENPLTITLLKSVEIEQRVVISSSYVTLKGDRVAEIRYNASSANIPGGDSVDATKYNGIIAVTGSHFTMIDVVLNDSIRDQASANYAIIMQNGDYYNLTNNTIKAGTSSTHRSTGIVVDGSANGVVLNGNIINLGVSEAALSTKQRNESVGIRIQGANGALEGAEISGNVINGIASANNPQVGILIDGAHENDELSVFGNTFNLGNNGIILEIMSTENSPSLNLNFMLNDGNAKTFLYLVQDTWDADPKFTQILGGFVHATGVTYSKFLEMNNVTGLTIANGFATNVAGAAQYYDGEAAVTFDMGEISVDVDEDEVDDFTVNVGEMTIFVSTLQEIFTDLDAEGPAATITVLKNVALGQALTVSTSITLDLNGKTISGDIDGAIIKVTGSGIDVTIKNGTVTNSAVSYGLHVTESAELRVDNLTVESGMDTILVGTKSPLSSGTLIIGGSKTKVTGTDTAILFYGASSSVTVTGGSFTGTKCGAIWGSGTATDGSSLTVTGGDINVGEGVDDDERTAIFIPHDGSVTISGGKITGPNALQILGKGPLSISGGIFTATGSVPEGYSKLSDGPVNAGSAVSIIYRAGGYGAAGELDASIIGGTFSSNNGGIALRVLNVSEDGTVHDNTSLLKNVKFISGGQFSSQPLAQFLVDNYISSESNGLWTVSYKAPSTPSTNTGSTSSSTTSKPKDEPPVEEPVTPTEPVAGEVTVETEVTNGGEVSFETPAAEGSEPVADAPVEISAVVLPEGTTGEVAFVPVSEQPAPEGKETQTKKVFEINVPTYEKGKAAVVKFTMTVAELAADGKTAAEVALWHFDEETGEWTKLVTSYTIVDGVVYFEAITYDFSPFAIIYEDAVEQPEQPVEEPETPASPVPVLGVLAALGAAVVLRRK